MNFKSEFDKYRINFETYLKKYMHGLTDIHFMLNESVNYSLFSGGKRIRPILMLAICDLLGGDKDNVYPFACALEMIHTYSLIHDDLPCMDNDAMRRGKPSNHVAYGEDIALLAGDGLLTQAFEIVSGIEIKDDMVKNQVRSINILANCAGTSGMISGQCYDLHMSADNISAKEVIELYRLKTSRLFCAACMIGAIMSGAAERDIELSRDYGEKLGIAFQLVDDILDDEEKILNAFREETPNEFLMRLTNETKEDIKKISGNTEFLMELTDYLTCRTG